MVKKDGTRWTFVSGRHPVLEAISARRPIEEVIIAEGVRGGNVQEIVTEAKKRGIRVTRAPRREVARLAQADVHQGVVAKIPAMDYVSLDVFLSTMPTDKALILAVDGVEDPQNLGALIRSADAAGAHGVVIPKHRAAGITTTVAKTSAGAVYHVPIVQVTNMARALEAMKEAGCWIYGASARGDNALWDTDLAGNVVIVVGSEGRGISRLVMEKCDFHVIIPMAGAVPSLNVSVAGALFLFEAQRQRRTTVSLP